MHVVSTIKELQILLAQHRNNGKNIGFVPTMGALHHGHLSLVTQAKNFCAVVVCSIFVNPTQFNNVDDLTNYPKTLENDLSILNTVGCDIVFCPDSNELYPTKCQLSFDFGYLEKIMEGAFRPGHFNGVGTVVAKFFNIIQPDHAFFGQKDLQQYAIIQLLVNDLSYQVQLHCCAIIREQDGLAMSSRNIRLNENQRTLAPTIFQSLQTGEKLAKNNSTLASIYNQMTDLYVDKNIKLEYYKFVNAEDLTEITTLVKGQKIAICVACYIDDIRLIDNIIFNA